ncbi:deoxyribonuclease IV [Candidatus Babeliales bacterium]|nr:deoxyribonuclease IV [Candidatus Babeliales bacterium]
MGKKPFVCGAHMSIAGGFDKAVQRGASIGCTALQIFTKSNRQWHARPIIQDSIAAFNEALQETGIQKKHIVAHASYLINLGATSQETFEKSHKALKEELSRCDRLGIPYLVLHPGSRGKQELNDALKQISSAIKETLSHHDGTAKLLIETMAGQGTNVGATFEEIAYLLQHINHPSQTGVCVDTCHIFAAGYDLRTKITYKNTWKFFDDIIGLHHVKAFHLNDSKTSLTSKIDRHEHIGKGKLGLEPFRLLMNDERFLHIPKLLETPDQHGLKDYERNLTILNNLVT